MYFSLILALNLIFISFDLLIQGEQNGYNIPEVCEANEVTKWFNAAGIGMDSEHPHFSYISSATMSNKTLGELSKRLICDAYMAFYQSTDVMMYQ